MKKLVEIRETLERYKSELQKRYKVREIGVFGSYVRGEQTPISDVDILVEFEDNADIGLLKFVNMENYLSELLGVKVDLVLKRALKPHIGKYILGEVIYI